jgi:hypothetical protein
MKKEVKKKKEEEEEGEIYIIKAYPPPIKKSILCSGRLCLKYHLCLSNCTGCGSPVFQANFLVDTSFLSKSNSKN